MAQRFNIKATEMHLFMIPYWYYWYLLKSLFSFPVYSLNFSNEGASKSIFRYIFTGRLGNQLPQAYPLCRKYPKFLSRLAYPHLIDQETLKQAFYFSQQEIFCLRQRYVIPMMNENARRYNILTPDGVCLLFLRKFKTGLSWVQLGTKL